MGGTSTLEMYMYAIADTNLVQLNKISPSPYISLLSD